MMTLRIARRRRTLRAVGCTIAAVLLVASCSSTVTGFAAKDPSFRTGDPLPALMNPGNYPTKPLAPLGKAGPKGKVVESHRLAQYVVGPWEVEPLLVDGTAFSTIAIVRAAALVNLIGANAGEIAARHNFVTGWGVDRTTKAPPGRNLSVVIMGFPSPEEAAGAAGDYAAQLATPANAAGAATRPYAIPGHPEGLARTYQDATDNTAYVQSFSTRGPFVISMAARAQEGNPDIAGGLIAKALDIQNPRLDEFKPTPPDKLADLPLDPTGLIAKTLPGAEADATIMEGFYEPRAALMLQIDPILSQKLFTEAGLSEVSLGNFSTLYQAKDRDGAQALFDGFKAGEASPRQKPAPPVPGFPGAKCFEGEPSPFGRKSFVCSFVADRYFVNITSTRDGEYQQRVAAQYLMLTAE